MCNVECNVEFDIFDRLLRLRVAVTFQRARTMVSDVIGSAVADSVCWMSSRGGAADVQSAYVTASRVTSPQTALVLEVNYRSSFDEQRQRLRCTLVDISPPNSSPINHFETNVKNVSETIRKPPLAEAQTALGKQKIRSVEREYLSHYRTSLKNCFPEQTFTETRKSAAELWPKTIFKIVAIRHLEF